MNTNANTQSDFVLVDYVDEYTTDLTDFTNPVPVRKRGLAVADQLFDPTYDSVIVLFECEPHWIKKEQLEIVKPKLDRSYHREYNTAL